MMDCNERIGEWERPGRPVGTRGLVPVLLAPRFVWDPSALSSRQPVELVPILLAPRFVRGSETRTSLHPPTRTSTRPLVPTGHRDAPLPRFARQNSFSAAVAALFNQNSL